MICQIVNRCHVGQSNRQVIRYAISRLRNRYQTFQGMTRKDRKTFLRDCIAAHEANRYLYNFAMGAIKSL